MSEDNMTVVAIAAATAEDASSASTVASNIFDCMKIHHTDSTQLGTQLPAVLHRQVEC